MPLHPDFLRPLAEFAETLANAPDAVEDAHAKEWYGQTAGEFIDGYFCEFIYEAAGELIDEVAVDENFVDEHAYRRRCEIDTFSGSYEKAIELRDDLRAWIKRIAALGKGARSATNATAQALRRKLSTEKFLGRMRFEKTNEFADRGGVLREYPTRIGPEAAVYQVIASALEAKSKVHVGRCEQGKDEGDQCHLWVVSASPKRPRVRCLPHSEEAKNRSKGTKKRLKRSPKK